jgi:hypothetical protein
VLDREIGFDFASDFGSPGHPPSRAGDPPFSAKKLPESAAIYRVANRTSEETFRCGSSEP